jgi:hypothetical protein
MPNLILALAIFFGGWWLLRKLGETQPAAVRGLMRKGAGVGLMGIGVVLAMRGALQIAAPIFLLGLGLFGQFANYFSSGAFWKKPAGQKSRVATSLIDMELDHDTGAMDGTVTAGPLGGRKLSSLSPQELSALAALCVSAGDQSAQLLEAWMDRNRPGWRSTQSQWQKPGGREATGTTMSEAEALAVLGLRQGASSADIRAAHRKLMKEYHPDRGGSTYLATKINLAKDRLLQD